MTGPDHRFSMDPSELSALVSGIRRIEANMGDAVIGPAPGEIEMSHIARRSTAAARDLPAEHIIESSDLAYQRPVSGMMPYQATGIIGRRVKKTISARSQIAFEHLYEDTDQ